MNSAGNEKKPEYIDREAFIKNLVKIDLRKLSTKTIGQAITASLAPDAEKVVHCEECVHCVRNNYTKKYVCSCMQNPNVVTPDHFCSFGKKKEGAASV